MQTKRTLFALAASLFFPCFFFAQNTTTFFHKNGPGWWTLGLDAGLAYQSSDVQTAWNGWGAGLTLGKNVAYRPGGLFSFDVRGRLLFDRSFGADSRRSFGLANNAALNGSDPSRLDYLIDKTAPTDSSFVFANHRTTMFEGGLEGVLTFNRLRERTGVVVNLFGGLGLDWYKTKIDQADAAGNYALTYLNINELGTRRNIINSLNASRDRIFETNADGFENDFGKIGLMPGLGLEVGFQVTPSFVIGVGHKITFSRTDILDGQQWTNLNQKTAKNDLAHYTNLHLRWDLEPARHRGKRPEIIFNDPTDNPHDCPSPNIFVRATVKNVGSAADVDAFFNGTEVPFQFSNPKFGINLRLKNGRNELKIRATNLEGEAAETLVLFYRDEIVVPPPPSEPRPEVRFTRPDRSPTTVREADFFATAFLKNVRSSREVRFFVNGSEESRFSLAEGFESRIRLREGRNLLKIEVRTAGGQASDEAEIFYEKPNSLDRPNVKITSVSQPTVGSHGCKTSFEARVEHVERRDDILVFLNGRQVSNWSWSSRSGLVTADFDLNFGENTILVKATNAAGSDQDEKSVRCDREMPPPPPQGDRPIVKITSPDRSPTTVEKSDFQLKASILNVENRRDLTFKFNGVETTAFDFDEKRGVLKADLKLKKGKNTASIFAKNRFGDDEASVEINFSEPIHVPKKPVVTILEPSNGAVLQQKTMILRAKILNVSDRSQIRVSQNPSTTISNFEFSTKTDELRATVELRDGDNSFTVKATNADGSDEATVRVRLEKVKMLPTVAFTDPTSSPTTTSQPSRRVTARTTNISEKNQVTFLVNGSTSTAFSFSSRDGSFSADVALKEGDNLLKIKVLNADGSAEATTTIRFQGVKKPPIVVISSPKNGAVVDKNEVRVEASITNVEAASGVSFLVNGSSVGRFSFSNGKFTATTSLREGENSMTVKATNADGSDEKTVKITYKPIKITPPEPAKLPTVVFTEPLRAGGTTTNGVATLKFKTTNVASKDELSLTQNGASVGDFSWNGRTGMGEATVKLAAGENKFQLTAKTKSGGQAKAETSLVFEQKTQPSEPKPTINIISASQPVTSPTAPNEGKSVVLAKIEHVKTASQIVVTFNGEPFTNFTFNGKTGDFQATFRLIRGENKVVLKATNSAGSAEASRVIVF